MAKSDYSQYILPVALVIGGYVVLKKFGLLGGSADNDSNNDSIASNNVATAAADLSAATSAGIVQSVPDSTLSTIANSIYTMGVSDDPDQDSIQNLAMQVNTQVDLLRLIQLFGVKKASASYWSTCNFLGFNCQDMDLGTFLGAVLDASHKASLNSYYSLEGLNFSV